MFLIGVVGNNDIIMVNHEIFDIPEWEIHSPHHSCRRIALTLLHDKWVIFSHVTAKDRVLNCLSVHTNILISICKIKFASEGSRPYKVHHLFQTWHWCLIFLSNKVPWNGGQWESCVMCFNSFWFCNHAYSTVRSARYNPYSLQFYVDFLYDLILELIVYGLKSWSPVTLWYNINSVLHNFHWVSEWG